MDALLMVKLVQVRNVCILTIKIRLLPKNPIIGINDINPIISKKPIDTLFLSVWLSNTFTLFGFKKPLIIITTLKIAPQDTQKLTKITP